MQDPQSIRMMFLNWELEVHLAGLGRRYSHLQVDGYYKLSSILCNSLGVSASLTTYTVDQPGACQFAFLSVLPRLSYLGSTPEVALNDSQT